MTHDKKINTLLDIARDLAMEELTRRAQKVLDGRNPAVGFIMGGGDAYFTDKEGQGLFAERQGDKRWLDSFYSWLYLYDEIFRLSATPLTLKNETK